MRKLFSPAAELPDGKQQTLCSWSGFVYFIFSKSIWTILWFTGWVLCARLIAFPYLEEKVLHSFWWQMISSKKVLILKVFFYLRHSEELKNVLLNLRNSGEKTLLLGVTFALLDFAEQFPLDFPELIVMETGGMKGRKKEMVRDEVHQVLKKGFGVRAIHSEYGMTGIVVASLFQRRRNIWLSSLDESSHPWSEWSAEPHRKREDGRNQCHWSWRTWIPARLSRHRIWENTC